MEDTFSQQTDRKSLLSFKLQTTKLITLCQINRLLGLGWDVPDILDGEPGREYSRPISGYTPAISLKKLLNVKKRQFVDLFFLGNIKQVKSISAGTPNTTTSRLILIIVNDIIAHNLDLITTGV
jgi:hypothetical protein